ncbi:hypothetical protein H8959_014148 [Pygathrix nigripes]
MPGGSVMTLRGNTNPHPNSSPPNPHQNSSPPTSIKTAALQTPSKQQPPNLYQYTSPQPPSKEQPPNPYQNSSPQPPSKQQPPNPHQNSSPQTPIKTAAPQTPSKQQPPNPLSKQQPPNPHQNSSPPNPIKTAAPKPPSKQQPHNPHQNSSPPNPHQNSSPPNPHQNSSPPDPIKTAAPKPPPKQQPPRPHQNSSPQTPYQNSSPQILIRTAAPPDPIKTAAPKPPSKQQPTNPHQNSSPATAWEGRASHLPRLRLRNRNRRIKGSSDPRALLPGVREGPSPAPAYLGDAGLQRRRLRDSAARDLVLSGALPPRPRASRSRPAPPRPGPVPGPQRPAPAPSPAPRAYWQPRPRRPTRLGERAGRTEASALQGRVRAGPAGHRVSAQRRARPTLRPWEPLDRARQGPSPGSGAPRGRPDPDLCAPQDARGRCGGGRMSADAASWDGVGWRQGREDSAGRPPTASSSFKSRRRCREAAGPGCEGARTPRRGAGWGLGAQVGAPRPGVGLSREPGQCRERSAAAWDGAALPAEAEEQSAHPCPGLSLRSPCRSPVCSATIPATLLISPFSGHLRPRAPRQALRRGLILPGADRPSAGVGSAQDSGPS